MLIIAALIAAAAYVQSARVTYIALRACQHAGLRNRATYGITGMIVSGFVLGSALEHLLP